MLTLRKASDRGHFDFGWLDTAHTFSFGEYHDPEHMGFRSLRVINDDLIAPAQGFGTHGHRDMEILSWVAEGSLEHKDSLGTGSVIRPGDLQRMSAGKGVRHSEFNPSPSERTRLLQIWLLPSRSGLEPSYEQKNFPVEGRTNRLQLIAAPESSGDAVSLHQDAELWTAVLDPGRSVKHEFRPGRHGWLQVVRGELEANGQLLEQGDGVALSDEKSLEVRAKSAAEFLLFDLA
ncbi:MAG TPA: pirin family protein [Planctomycetota bacterium]|nr:pirin family protein [Planctomycetota bacterium]